MPPDRLASTCRGDGDRLVLVHGFTQTGRSWDGIRARLGEQFQVVAVDAPGHGASGDVTVGLVEGAALLGAAGGRATYVGYSMGGRLCLQLALDHPELVERLVLVSATAGIDDDEERAVRRASDDALADAIETDGIDAFLDRWLALPLFATLPPEAAGVDDRRRNTASGLASSLRLAGTGTQIPSWGRLPMLTMPVLLVAGSKDTKFVALAERMAGLLPDAELVILPDAGHTAHLEQPDAFTAVLRRWLRPFCP